MDRSLQILSSLFNQTINPKDPKDIKEAEEQLKRCLQEAGFMQALMLLSNNQQESLFIRQAAIAHLKLVIQRHWNSDKVVKLSDTDKSQVKDNLHQALIISLDQPKISKIYEAILEKVAMYDFPHKWPALAESCLQKIQAPSTAQEFYGSLLVFKCVVKCFYAYMGEDRKDIDPVIETYLPAIANALKLSLQQTTIEAQKSVHLCLKIVYYSVRFHLPSYFNNEQNLEFWMLAFQQIYDSPLAPELTKLSDCEDERAEKASHLNWKLKSKTCQILQRFIQKLNSADEKDNTGFYTPFLNTYSMNFLNSFIKMLNNVQTHYIPEKVLMATLKYLYTAVKIKSTFKHIQPHLLQIMTNICLPLSKLTKQDIELFQHDPEEYIKKSENYFFTPLIQSQDLITLICKKNDQNKQSYLLQFLKFITSQLQTQDVLQKEMLFHMLGHLHQEIQSAIEKKKISTADIEQLMVAYVEPCLSHESPLLRSRSLYLVSKYSTLTFKNPDFIPNCIKKVCACIVDQYLPVKIQASICINCLLSQKQAVDMLRPELNTILEKYVEIMQKVDHEGVVLALEGIVQNFAVEIQPYAVQLVQQLSLSFLNYAKKSMQQAEKIDNDDYDGSTEMTAASCLSAVKSILAGELPMDAYSKVIPVLIPVFNFVFSSDGCDYIDEGSDILNIVLYHLDFIEPQLWFYFPAMCYLLISVPEHLLQNSKLSLDSEQTKILYDARENFGQEFCDAFLPCLKNFIQKGFNQIVTEKDFFGVSFVDLIFQVIEKFNTITSNSSFGENLKINTLFVCLLENGLGKIDELYSRILVYSLKIFMNSKKKTEQTTHLETICMCFYYNPELTLQYLNSQNCTDQVLTKWFSLLPNLKYDYQKTRSLFAMCSLLKIERSKLPQALLQSIGVFLEKMVKLTTEILEMREKEEPDEDDEDSEDIDQNDLDDLDDALDIKGKKITLGKFDNKDLQDDPDDASYDSDQEYRDQITYDSPLENICEVLFMKEVLENIARIDQELYRSIEGSMDQNTLQTLQKNFKVALEQDIEYQKNKAQEKQ